VIADQLRVLVHIEQLHLPVPACRSSSAVKRTAPQWQLPRWVCMAMSVFLLKVSGEHSAPGMNGTCKSGEVLRPCNQDS
jgi:hypothetical protein